MIPTDKSSRTVADTIERDFGGTGASPLTIAVTTSRGAGAAEVAALRRRGQRARRASRVRRRPVQLGETTWQLDVAAAGDPDGATAQRLGRGDPGRAAGPGVDALVAGPAAEFVDQQSAIGSRLPLAVGLLWSRSRCWCCG